MRRGQSPRETPEGAFSKRELMHAAKMSAGLFDSIRKAARVRGPAHGGMDWAFSREDVLALIHRARDGRFRPLAIGASQAWETLLNPEEEAAREANGADTP